MSDPTPHSSSVPSPSPLAGPGTAYETNVEEYNTAIANRAADDLAHAHEEGEAMTPKKIWRVFWVLSVITSIEFFITLYLVPTFHWNGGIKAFVLIALTLLKAFYIVAYFMHLRFERLTLIYCIIMPTILIIGLVAGLISEGHHWLSVR